MEEKSQESPFEMHLDDSGGNILRETVRWSRFLSIVGLAGVGICVLVAALGGSSLLAVYSRTLPGIEAFTGFIILGILIVLAVLGLLMYMLYRFSVLTRKGIETQDQSLFNRGLKGLKIYFLISGIFAILGLLFNLLNLASLI